MAFKKLFALCILLPAVIGAPVSNLFTWCDGRYCYHSDGSLRIRSLEKAQVECQQLKNISWTLEIYNQSVQDSVMTFIDKFPKLQTVDVLLNLRRVDNKKWKWITGEDYNDELSAQNLSVRIFNREGPFSTLRNLPLKGIYGDTYSTTKLENYMCSYDYSCSSNRTAITVDDICYVIYTNKKETLNWFDANSICSAQGGKLAVFPKMSAATLKLKFTHFTTTWANYWIGLVKSYWAWKRSQDSISDFTYWYNGYPYHPFLAMDPSKITTYLNYRDGGIWMDTHRNYNMGLICMSSQVEELGKSEPQFSK